jgi:hypothetical protein
VKNWNSGTMYWPFLKFKQPKRGFYLWLVGCLFTFFFWHLFFFFTGNPDAIVEANALKTQFYNSLGWTQWVAFFTCLTIIVYKYRPWSKLAKKQPYIGIITFLVCFFLGLLISAFFPFLVPIFFDPLFLLLGQSADIIQKLDGWYKMGVTYPTFLILALFLMEFFFKNWFKRYKYSQSLIFRTFLIFVIGTISFLLFSLFSPFLIGVSSNIWNSNPIPFLFWFFYIILLYIYVWKKWPYYKIYKAL